MDISSQAKDITLEVLQQISENPDLINTDERFKSLIAKIYKQSRKANKKSQDKAKQTNSTNRSQFCFICQQYFTQYHHFYPDICFNCGHLNYVKRNQTIDLKNRIALVTGARLRIGYATALKLLRSGATVIATTRFPHDAAKRYANEIDFEEWQNCLHIYGLDLRHLKYLDSFIKHFIDCYSRLDIIINNAAQTVRRPPLYYRHLLDFESSSRQHLPKQLQALVSRNHNFCLDNDFSKFDNLIPNETRKNKQQAITKSTDKADFSALLSQINAIAEDLETDPNLFPQGQYNHDGEQLDLRRFNSWLMKDEEVEILELLEVQIINAIAPFVINSRLKDLMKRSPELDKYIINVSSAEGRFDTENKSWRHPHTNMAKAALNQMTKTCAKEYAQHRIFMNVVDPGWVSFQQPHSDVQKMKEKGLKFHLDTVDSAARICDPLYLGITKQKYPYGKLFRNYQEISW